MREPLSDSPSRPSFYFVDAHEAPPTQVRGLRKDGLSALLTIMPRKERAKRSRKDARPQRIGQSSQCFFRCRRPQLCCADEAGGALGQK